MPLLENGRKGVAQTSPNDGAKQDAGEDTDDNKDGGGATDKDKEDEMMTVVVGVMMTADAYLEHFLRS